MLIRHLPRSLQGLVLNYLSADYLQDIRVDLQVPSSQSLIDDHVYWRIRHEGFVPRRRKFSCSSILQACRVINNRLPIPDQRTLRNLLCIFLMSKMHDILAICFEPPYNGASIVRLTTIVKCNSLRLLDLWLSAANSDPGYMRNEGLMTAVNQSRLDIVQRLINDSRVNCFDRNCQAFLDAAASGRCDVLRLLLYANRASLRFSAWNRAVCEAVRAGHYEICQLLLSYTDGTSAWTHTADPVGLASRLGRYEILSLLQKDLRFAVRFSLDNKCIDRVQT